MILYGIDRAYGNEAETTREWRKRRRSIEEVPKTVNDIDNLISQNKVKIPKQEHSSTTINGACIKRIKKVAKEKDNNIKELIGAIRAVTQAIEQGNMILAKICKPVPQLSSEELWKMLEECGCDAKRIPDIYCFLMCDVDRLRAAIQCPISARKQVIMMMFSGSN
ncbi:uncharacterized protein LOC129298960 [Prosopis cineraria]|uniref:uncharacterized protein LOC129298960 n=1 Tax=Prosopis cineraria TaxID=364024 RepID=UPI00240F53EE|nr:uncharacterized protein LOC129298960 [Prosopis cineraria]